jgi:hypothetical protein
MSSYDWAVGMAILLEGLIECSYLRHQILRKLNRVSGNIDTFY